MNEQNYNDLKKYILEGKVVPFVGAGVSMAVLSRDKKGIFPTWIGLLNILADGLEECGEENEAEIIRLTLKRSKIDYLKLADDIKKYYPTPREYNRKFEEIFNILRSDIDDSSLDLARAIWGLGQKLIITTNYDKIMHWASDTPDDTEQWNIESAIEQASSIQDGVKKQTVWHLHGRISEKSSIILTTDSYDELYRGKKFETAYETLKLNLASKSFLFIGYSLDDEYLVNELEKISNTFKGQSATHYVLIKEGTKLPEKLKNKIIPISYEDHGDPLIKKLKELSPSPKLPKEIDRVVEILKERFPAAEELKKKLFEYLSPDESEYHNIRDEEDYSYLLHKALEQKDCLYCIFKELKIDNDYLENFQNSCKIAKQRVKKLVLRIAKDSNGKINSCVVEGWVIFDSGAIVPFSEKLDNIDFSRSNYVDQLSTYLTDFLKYQNVVTPLDTELILDDGLFHIDFRLIELEGISNPFKATVRIYWRDSNFYSDSIKINNWKSHSHIYRNGYNKTIESNIQPINNSSDIEYCLEDCIEERKIVVVSRHCLFDDKYLEMIKAQGLPLIFSPCSTKPTDVDFEWEDKSLGILREEAMKSLKLHYRKVARDKTSIQEKLVHFVHDDYFEVEKFKEMINDTKEYLA